MTSDGYTHTYTHTQIKRIGLVSKLVVHTSKICHVKAVCQFMATLASSCSQHPAFSNGKLYTNSCTIDCYKLDRFWLIVPDEPDIPWYQEQMGLEMITPRYVPFPTNPKFPPTVDGGSARSIHWQRRVVRRFCSLHCHDTLMSEAATG